MFEFPNLMLNNRLNYCIGDSIPRGRNQEAWDRAHWRRNSHIYWERFSCPKSKWNKYAKRNMHNLSGETNYMFLNKSHMFSYSNLPFNFMFIRKTMWKGKPLEDWIVGTYITLSASNNGCCWRMFVQFVRRQLWKLMKISMKVIDNWFYIASPNLILLWVFG